MVHRYGGIKALKVVNGDHVEYRNREQNIECLGFLLRCWNFYVDKLNLILEQARLANERSMYYGQVQYSNITVHTPRKDDEYLFWRDP